ATRGNRCGGDPRTRGLSLPASGVGGLPSAASSGPLGRITRQGRAMLCTVAVWGGASAGFAVAPRLWLALSLLAVAGAADAFTVGFRGAIVAAATPHRLRRRGNAGRHALRAGRAPICHHAAGAPV